MLKRHKSVFTGVFYSKQRFGMETRMSYTTRREALFDKMENHSVLYLFSGIPLHISADEYAPFEANRHFFYLTGLRRERMILRMSKAFEEVKTTLYIEEADALEVRWYGKKLLVDEAREITGIDDIKFLEDFESDVNRDITRGDVEKMYFDCYREGLEDLPDYNLVKSQEFAAKYPGVSIINVWPIIAEMRMQKDADEIECIKAAIGITDDALKNVLLNLRPGMREYQAQADFEYIVHYNGADGVSFPTIAGSGINGTMLHYETNEEECEDGTLLLMDLGAKYKGYCADITRTYPVNGKYTPQQRQVYDIVLRANRAMAELAKPGMTLRELNEECKKILAEGCIELGLISDASEIEKYYMHGVSHHLGIDVHDVVDPKNNRLRPGAVISDEPGLYIDEWEIGIRIEDDLLITEDGCICLSEQIMRTPEEIEAYMASGIN